MKVRKTYSVGAVQTIDVQLLIFLLAGRRLALRRSSSAARRRECRHAAMYTPSGEHPLTDHQLQPMQSVLNTKLCTRRCTNLKQQSLQFFVLRNFQQYKNNFYTALLHFKHTFGD